jgi:hypothetical protein
MIGRQNQQPAYPAAPCPGAKHLGKGQATAAGAASPQGADERRSARSTVLLTAEIECAGKRVPVRVINLSAHGALVQGAAMPDTDSEVMFHCNDVGSKGWMAWVQPPHAGISFDEAIKLSALRVKSKSGAEMIIRDMREVDFRRPGFRGNQMSAEEHAVVAKWLRGQDPQEGGQ